MKRREWILPIAATLMGVGSFECFFAWSTHSTVKALAEAGIAAALVLMAAAPRRIRDMAPVICACAVVSSFIVVRASRYPGLFKDEDVAHVATSMRLFGYWFVVLIAACILLLLGRVLLRLLWHRSTRDRSTSG